MLWYRKPRPRRLTVLILLNLALFRGVDVSASEVIQIIDLHFHAQAGWSFEQLVGVFDQVGVPRGCNGAKGPDGLGISFAINLPDRYLPYGGQGSPLRRLIREFREQAWNLESQEVLNALETLERRLRNGLFSGIGELFPNNLNSRPPGSTPDPLYPADSALMQRLWAMSIEFQVPLSVHMEAVDPTTGDPTDSVAEMERLLASDLRGTWIWAHAGVFAQPPLLRRLLTSHPNLYIELSTRDFRRSLQRRVTDDDGILREDWMSLLEDFADRVLIGTDVDEPDPDMYERLINYWRSVLDQLPDETAAKIAYLNAERLSFCDQRVRIDIKPGGSPSSINSKSRGTIPVAIFSTRLLDGNTFFDVPARVDPDSLTFGRRGDEASLAFCKQEDVDGDGLLDMVCHFKTQMTGFQTGDTAGVLRGKTFGGTPLRGVAPVRVHR